jgi:hypothetical protein
VVEVRVRRGKPRVSTLLAIALAALVAVAAVVANQRSGTGYTGQRRCVGDFGYRNELKVEPAENRVYADGVDKAAVDGAPGALVVRISNLRVDPVENVAVFDWTSNIAVRALLVQARRGGFKYDYDGATAGTAVVAPKQRLESVSFCY